MLERQVDDSVGGLRTSAQAVQVVEVALVHLGAHRLESLRRRIGARQPEYLMTCGDELRNNGRTDEPGRACDEHSHWNLPLMSVAVITVTSMTAAVIPLRSRHEPLAAQRARPPGAGGAGPLHRARLRPDDRRGDRRTSGTDRANVLPALRRQTR